jgi:hypothetical protein
MITNAQEQTISSPVLIDQALAPIQEALEAELSWLTSAYGKAYKINSQGATVPVVHSRDSEQINLLPDEHLGNYAWFDVQRDEIDNGKRSRVTTQFTAGLILFWDFRTVYPGEDNTRTTQHVKDEVIRAIAKARRPLAPACAHGDPRTITRRYGGGTHTRR